MAEAIKDYAAAVDLALAALLAIAFKIFSLQAKNTVNVDLILRSVGRRETKDICRYRSGPEVAGRGLGFQGHS